MLIPDKNLYNFFKEVEKEIQSVMRDDNCIQMEGAQVYLHGVLSNIRESFTDIIETNDFFTLSKKLSSAANIIRSLSNESNKYR